MEAETPVAAEAEKRTSAPFGEWLMQKLKERSMSLSDVARLAQCDYTYLWRLVNVGRARGRQYRRPSYDMAERIGRALGATHEALTAAGYLPVENVQNSRVVDTLERVEQQLARLREELTQVAQSATTPETTDGSRRLPLGKSDAWPEDPDAAPEQIALPAWLAAEAHWAARVGAGSAAGELRAGDLALIRRGTPAPGQWAAVRRDGQLIFVADAGEEAAVGSVTGLVRRFSGE